MPCPIIAVHVARHVRRSSTEYHQLASSRYPDKGVCSRTGAKGKRPLYAATGVGRYMLNRGLTTELSLAGYDRKGDLTT